MYAFVRYWQFWGRFVLNFSHNWKSNCRSDALNLALATEYDGLSQHLDIAFKENDSTELSQLRETQINTLHVGVVRRQW